MNEDDPPEGDDSDKFPIEQVVETYAASLLGAGLPVDRNTASIWQAQVDELKRQVRRERRPEVRSANTIRRVTSRQKKKVLLVENDRDVAWDYKTVLHDVDFAVTWVRSADSALKTASVTDFEAVVIDIRMPHGKAFRRDETVYGRRTGVELAKELMSDLPDAFLVALSNSNDALDVAWFEAHGFGFAHKATYPPRVFARYLRRKLFNETPRVFIVHGHDLQSAYELRDYLQRVMKFDAVILKDRASLNKTVIEKFEDWAEQSDIVFALFTPDDPGKDNQGRARQNVVFEYGYFIGKFGRKSGKVIFMSKKGVEIPSDLAGLIPIDISEGIWAASDEIRRELQEYLD